MSTNIDKQTTVVVTCDGPRCKGNKTQDGPTVFTWTEEAAAKDVNAVPNDAWRLLILSDFQNNKAVFCCPRCLADFMLKSYVPLRSPSEEAAIAAANAPVANKSGLSVVPPQAENLPTAEDLDKVSAEKQAAAATEEAAAEPATPVAD